MKQVYNSYIELSILKKDAAGQSLAEFTLIGGLISIVAVGSLSIITGVFNAKQADMFQFFGQAGQNNPPPSTLLSNNTAGNGPNTTTALNETVSADLNAFPKVGTLATNNANLQKLYEDLQNGTASMAEVSGWYGETAKSNLAIVAHIEQVANVLKDNNPSLAADLYDLAKTGKILAGWQGSVALEGLYGAHAHNPYPGVEKDLSNQNEWVRKIAMETATPINGWSADGQDAQGGLETNEVYGPLDAAKISQEIAQSFSQQWQVIQNNPSVMKKLSAEGQTLVKKAAIAIEANANINTSANALETYANSTTIHSQQAQADVCANGGVKSNETVCNPS